MATSTATLEEVACSKSQLSESSYNGSAAADVVPYELWSNWSEQEVASWVRSHPSLKSYLQCVFEWLGIDGQSMQMLLFVSKSNEYLWKETSLTEEEKAFLSEELCRLLGPPIDKPPLIPPTPTPSSDSTPPNSRKKVTFSDAIDERLISCREPGRVQDYYKNPDLSSKQLQQKVFLAKAASQLRAQLQVFYNCGKGLKLKKSDIDDHVLRYCFDGLGDTLQTLVQKAYQDSISDYSDPGTVPQKPQLNETEKNLLVAFKHTWRQVSYRRGAPAKMILSWFNDALLKAGLPTWGPNGRRWNYVQYKLGLADRSNGWLPSGHGLQERRHMSSPITPYRLISPLKTDISPICRNV